MNSKLKLKVEDIQNLSHGATQLSLLKLWKKFTKQDHEFN